MKNPKDNQAVDAEWEQLAKQLAWNLLNFRPNDEVITNALKKKVIEQLGTLKDPHHRKHSELADTRIGELPGNTKPARIAQDDTNQQIV